MKKQKKPRVITMGIVPYILQQLSKKAKKKKPLTKLCKKLENNEEVTTTSIPKKANTPDEAFNLGEKHEGLPHGRHVDKEYIEKMACAFVKLTNIPPDQACIVRQETWKENELITKVWIEKRL